MVPVGVFKRFTRAQQRLVTDNPQPANFFVQALGVVDVPGA
jgi:hypothetical protein